MPWTAPVDPIPGQVITADYAITNLCNPIRWLRLLTGNADPPGSSYVVVSSSASAAAWGKITADVLGTGAVVGHLGYTPINKAGDTGIGNLTSVGTIQAGALVSTGNISTTAGTVSAAVFSGGTTASGGVSAQGFAAGTAGFAGGPHSGTTLSFTGNGNVNGTLTAGIFNGGTTASGGVQAAGFAAGTGGISSTGLITAGSISASGNIAAPTGTISAAVFTGGSLASGGITALGFSAGASGIATVGNITSANGDIALTNGDLATANGTVSGAVFTGGSTGAGGVSALGLAAGTAGVSTTGQLASTVATGTAPLAVNSQTRVTNLHADLLDGAHASATSTPNAIPIADAAGTLDDWVTPSSFVIPSGLGFWVRAAADIPAGFARDTAFDGVLLVGDGTTFGQTFNAGASLGQAGTSYGSSWAHQHGIDPLGVGVTSVTVTGSAVGGPEDNTAEPSAVNGLAAAGGVNLPTDSHSHSLNGVSMAVSASGTGSGSTASGSTNLFTWLPPMRAVVWIRKS